MRRVKVFLFIGLIMIPFLPSVSAQTQTDPPVPALSLSYPSLHLYPLGETFSDPNFYFKVTNSGNVTLTIKAGSEVNGLVDWQNLFTITFDKNDVVLNTNESVIFYPTVVIKTNLTYDYLLHFVFSGLASVNGTYRLIGSAGATAIFSVNSKVDASRLSIETYDQGEKSRKSRIVMQFSKDEPAGFSAFKTLTDISYFSDIVPNGFYRIEATDLETDISEFTIVNLTKDTDVKISYKIIAFLPFEIFAPDNVHDDLIINYTVVNEYRLLVDVTIRIRVLASNNQTIKDADVTNPIPEFQRGSYRRTLNVTGIVWVSDTYRIQGFIYVGDDLYMMRQEELTLNFFIIEEFFDAIGSVFSNPLLPYFAFGFMGLFIGVMVMKYNDKYKKPKVTLVAEPAQSSNGNQINNENELEPVDL